MLLGCESGGKYRKYKNNLEVSVTSTRKCDCPFKFRGKPVWNGEDRVLKVICEIHNHELTDILVGPPYASKLKSNKHFIDMTKSLVKSINILLTLRNIMRTSHDNKTSVTC